jgi:DNA-binding PucR family transcriptional regulator
MLFAGISNSCSGIRDYKRGFVEAQEALQIGESLHRYVGSARFSELGAYRYLYPFAHERRLSDRYLDHIEAIAHYDREHKRGNLLSSLETYLGLGGNIKDAAEQLKVHRNTLTQRLERIQSICKVDLNAYAERFSLQLALMVYRLRSQDR